MCPGVGILLYALGFKRKRRTATEMSSSRLRTQPSHSLHPELQGSCNTSSSQAPHRCVCANGGGAPERRSAEHRCVCANGRGAPERRSAEDAFTAPENEFSCKLKSNFTTRRREN